MPSLSCCYLAGLVMGFSACASEHDLAMISRRGRERLLVGTWQSEPGDDSWIITRRADHTFTEERTVAYPQPRTHFSSTGTWRVSGDGYYTRYTTVTHPFFASKLVGREIRAHIWQ